MAPPVLHLRGELAAGEISPDERQPHISNLHPYLAQLTADGFDNRRAHTQKPHSTHLARLMLCLQQQIAREQVMQNVQPSLFARDDTFFGTCQGLGEDLGFNPDWLRVAFIPLLFFYPAVAIGSYLAASAIVLTSRLVFPARRTRPAQVVGAVQEEASASATAPTQSLHAQEPERLAA